MNKKPISLVKHFMIVFGIGCLFSCSSINPSTVQLSAEVGKRMNEMQSLHMKAIHNYFDLEEQKINDFVDQTWKPLFLKNFIAESKVLDLLQNVSRIDEQTQTNIQKIIGENLADPSESQQATAKVLEALNKSRDQEEGAMRTILKDYIEDNKVEQAANHIYSILGTDEPAQIIFEFTEQANLTIEEQRAELLAPIREARNATVAQLGADYAELIRGQSTVTGRLQAASKADQQNAAFMNAIGLGQMGNSLNQRMANVSNTVNSTLLKANNLLNAVDNNTDFGGNVGGIMSELQTGLNSMLGTTPINSNSSQATPGSGNQ